MKAKLILLSFLLITSVSITFAQSYKVIVNSGNSTASVTKKEASDLFLKKKSKWEDGTKVVPVDQASGAKVREVFSQQIHGKGTSAIRSYWQQAAFSGTASALPEKANDAEVIEFVKKNPGSVGYVSSSTSTDGVKVIQIN